MKKIFFLVSWWISISALGQSADSTIIKNKPWKKVIIPAALITGGILTADEDDFINRFNILEDRKEHSAFFDTHIEDYVQYAPTALVYGLNIAGIRGKNHVVEQTILIIKSELMMGAVIFALKNTTNVRRPDNSTYNSFPSGHTAQAFVAATFLHKEYGHRSIFYSIGGYAAATLVGTMRVLGNRHWLSDVMVGAAVGILSTELAYATHQFKWNKKRMKLVGMPTINKDHYGLYVSLSL